MIKARRSLVMFCLVLAGEGIFSLPFHVARFFRPTVLEVFNLSNAQLGDIFAAYGVTAMLAYFPGGLIADRVSARVLITTSLLATAAGGVVMASIPAPAVLTALFAYWGVTTIFLFWAALIRATREWGGALAQGAAFGFLDGGRGLIAAGLASIAVLLFGLALPETGGVLDPAERREGLRTVIYFYTATTLAAAALSWWLIPSRTVAGDRRPAALAGIGTVLRQPVVWVQATIVVCAYSGYKGLDNYSLYAHQVLGLSELEAARFTAASSYLRPVAAIAAGLLADRLTARNVICGIFLILCVSYLTLGLSRPTQAALSLIYANLFITFFGVFALRGVYFALLEETRIAPASTGTAVGIISVVGFTPDVFFAPISGRLLDAAPGLAGHQHYFLLLAAIAFIGTAAAWLLTAAFGSRPERA